MILRCQRILFSAYRSDQYADPEGFMASLGAVLEQYPSDVVIYITDPRTGVQRGKVFPPTIAEIVAAADARIADIRRREKFEKWGQQNISMLEAPRHKRPSMAELKEKYGENWGINPPPDMPAKPAFKAPTADQLQEHYAKHGIGFTVKKDEIDNE